MVYLYALYRLNTQGEIMRTITIRIYPDGVVHTETNGIKGKKCTDYIPIIERLVNARHSEVELTEEYYENELIETYEEQIKIEK